MLSKEELIEKLNNVSDNTSAENARDLFNDLSDYLNDIYDGPQPWDDNTGDVTPEYAAWEKKALEEDLGTNADIFETLNALQSIAKELDKEEPDEKDLYEKESDEDNPHDEKLVKESEKILDKIGTQVMDNVVDEHINKTRKAGASFEPHSEEAVQAMLEANRKGTVLSDATVKNIVGTLSQYRW